MRRIFKMNVFLCSIFLVMLGILGTKTPISQVYAADSKIAIQKCVGGDEMAIVEFAKVAGCNLADYAVSYQKQGTSEYTAIDKELIRDYDSYIRADLVGLTPGTYSLKVKAGTTESTISNVVVTAQDRSGYAHFNATEGVGAYNNDGSLKSNAQVVYVTEANKNTVQAKIGSKTYTGLASILQNQQKGTTPLVIRVIGQVAAATWKGLDYNMSSLTPDDVKGQNGQPLSKQNYTQDQIISDGFNELDTSTYSQLNGLTNKIKYDSSKTEFDSYYNMLDVSGAKNVTLEGIGTDAVFFQWGLTWKSCSSIEVRNLTFKNYPEDACSFEGGSGTYSSVNDFKSTRYWVHHNTFYLGVNTWDVCNEQDKHDGDGCTDFKYCAYVTVSYNHYIKTHKTGLVGGSDSQQSANFTYHHNFYDTCQARLPFARQANLHLYNNYYYASTGNNMQIYAKAYAFIEYCYFENVAKPMIIDSKNGKAAVKIYETTFSGCGTVAGTKVTSRTAVVDNENIYGSQFDQNATQFYYDTTNQKSKVSLLHTAAEAKEYCKVYSGALKESFTGNGGAITETLTAEDVINLIANLPEKSAVTLSDKDAINAAKSAYDSLESAEQAKVTNVTKLNEALEALQILLEGEQPEQPDPVAPTPDYVHNFTESGKNDTFFSITGNLATNKGTVEYNGLTLTQCLKMESATIISFTTTEKMKLTLVFVETTGNVKIDGTAKDIDASGIVTYDLEAGTHEIKKGTTSNLFYISLASTSLKAVIENGMVGTAFYQKSNSLRMVTKLTNVTDLASIVSATYTIEVYQNENDSEPKYTKTKVITKAYSVVNGINTEATENEYYIVYILTNIDGNNGELDGMTFKITCSLELEDKTITSNEYSFILTLNEGV